MNAWLRRSFLLLLLLFFLSPVMTEQAAATAAVDNWAGSQVWHSPKQSNHFFQQQQRQQAFSVIQSVSLLRCYPSSSLAARESREKVEGEKLRGSMLYSTVQYRLEQYSSRCLCVSIYFSSLYSVAAVKADSKQAAKVCSLWSRSLTVRHGSWIAQIALPFLSFKHSFTFTFYYTPAV